MAIDNMQQIKLTVTPDKQYYCEPLISPEEWEGIIAEVEKSRKWQLDTLLMFYRSPGHKATCGAIGKEYSMSFSVVNGRILSFNKFAREYTGKRFQIIEAEGNEETFWPISMIGKNLKDNSFEYTVRPELCAALRKYLIKSMLREYRTRILSEGLNNSVTNEKYKWEIMAASQGKSTSEILEVLLSRSCNFIEKPYAGATVQKLLRGDRKEALCEVFDILRRDGDLSERGTWVLFNVLIIS